MVLEKALLLPQVLEKPVAWKNPLGLEKQKGFGKSQSFKKVWKNFLAISDLEKSEMEPLKAPRRRRGGPLALAPPVAPEKPTGHTYSGIAWLGKTQVIPRCW